MQLKKYEQPMVELRRVQTIQRMAAIDLLSWGEDYENDPFAPKDE